MKTESFWATFATRYQILIFIYQDGNGLLGQKFETQWDFFTNLIALDN